MCVAGVVEVGALRMGWSGEWEWECWRGYGRKMVIGWGDDGFVVESGYWNRGSVPVLFCVHTVCVTTTTRQIDAAALLNDLSVFQKFINLLDLWSHWALCVGNRISVQYLGVALALWRALVQKGGVRGIFISLKYSISWLLCRRRVEGAKKVIWFNSDWAKLHVGTLLVFA